MSRFIPGVLFEYWHLIKATLFRCGLQGIAAYLFFCDRPSDMVKGEPDNIGIRPRTGSSFVEESIIERSLAFYFV